jgi:hypothetical protein
MYKPRALLRVGLLFFQTFVDVLRRRQIVLAFQYLHAAYRANDGEQGHYAIPVYKYSERTHHKEDSRTRNVCNGARTEGNICIGARMFTYNAHVITCVLGARCYRRHSLIKYYSRWSGLLRRWYGRGGPISPSCPSVR